MKTILMIFWATVLSMSLAQAQAQKEGELSPAAKLMELFNTEKVMVDTAKAAFSPFLKQMKDTGLSDEAIEEISEAADVYFGQVASDADLKKELIGLYEKEFTEEELNGLLEFYQTPLGQKTLQRLPQLMQQGAKLGEKYAQRYAGDFQKQMTRILEKHQKKADKEGQ